MIILTKIIVITITTKITNNYINKKNNNNKRGKSTYLQMKQTDICKCKLCEGNKFPLIIAVYLLFMCGYLVLKSMTDIREPVNFKQ